MALLMMDEEEESKKHFNYNKIVEHQNLSKKKKKHMNMDNGVVTVAGRIF